VLDVQSNDSIVMTTNVVHRVTAGRSEVANVKIHCQILRSAMQRSVEGFLGGELIRIGGVIMSVETHCDLVFLPKRIHPRGHAHIGRRSDVAHAQQLSELEAEINVFVGHPFAEAISEGVEIDSGLVELRPNIFEIANRLGAHPFRPSIPIADTRRGKVNVRQFALAQTRRATRLDRICQGHVAKGPTLNSDLYSPDLGVDGGFCEKLLTAYNKSRHTPQQQLAGLTTRHRVHVCVRGQYCLSVDTATARVQSNRRAKLW